MTWLKSVAVLGSLFVPSMVAAQPTKMVKKDSVTPKPSLSAWQREADIFCDWPSQDGKVQDPRRGSFSWPKDHPLGLRGEAQRLSSIRQRLDQLAALKSDHPAFGKLFTFDLALAAALELQKSGAKMTTIGLKPHLAADETLKDRLTLMLFWSEPNAEVEVHVFEPRGFHLHAETTENEAVGSRLAQAADKETVAQYTTPILQTGPYRVVVRCKSGCSERAVAVELAGKLHMRGFPRYLNQHVLLEMDGDTKTIFTHWEPKLHTKGKDHPTLAHLSMRAPEMLQQGRYPDLLALSEAVGVQRLVDDEARRLFFMRQALRGMGEVERCRVIEQRHVALTQSTSKSGVAPSACLVEAEKKEGRP